MQLGQPRGTSGKLVSTHLGLLHSKGLEEDESSGLKIRTLSTEKEQLVHVYSVVQGAATT